MILFSSADIRASREPGGSGGFVPEAAAAMDPFQRDAVGGCDQP